MNSETERAEKIHNLFEVHLQGMNWAGDCGKEKKNLASHASRAGIHGAGERVSPSTRSAKNRTRRRSEVPLCNSV